MLSQSEHVVFVCTSNPEAAKRFYAETLGLPFVRDDPFALVFDLRGTMLRVEKVPAHVPHGHTVLGWKVASIADAVADLAGRGVRFERYEALAQDEQGVWRSPSGARVAWFKDPDGNTLSLTQW